MADITFSNENMQYINMASRITRTEILDCMITEDKLIFIVQKGQLGLAIGVKAKNLEKLRNLFKKNIKFVEYDPDKEKFIYNLCKPYRVNKIELEGEDDSVIAKIEVNVSDKSKLIGKDGRNIDAIRQLARRHHSIKDVQVK
ncbi:MAG: NusA-like transcription termination signal-binding factor [Thermoplasmata archaeon]|nr:MAG: NusA-like transcription termination signal-binding factor [Thermoplasmata archaeon]RLF31505.1 MAG: NusA-like transcription termination signal-binding factor [Thermoplasmata archaeon]RLF36672.1 MAG: NusA-like transcription termination signal-binding factor [Thermoplasmata archaeon]RLF52605.1 MAG: NusA-like transcription termination signal-binding factor [Thermoplasmata archaeon]